MAKHLVLVCLLIALTGCGKLPLGMLSGGGPNVAANTQVGRENVQQAVAQQTRTTAGRDVVTNTREVQADQVEAVTINNQQVPLWMVALMLFGFILWSYLLWMLPSPDQIWRKK